MHICLDNKHLFKLLADYFKIDYPEHYTDCSIFLEPEYTILTCTDKYGGLHGERIDYRCTELFLSSPKSSLYLANRKYSLAVIFSSRQAEFLI